MQKLGTFCIAVLMLTGYGVVLYLAMQPFGLTTADVWRGGVYWLIYFGVLLLLSLMANSGNKAEGNDSGSGGDDGGTDPSADPLTPEELEELYNNTEG